MTRRVVVTHLGVISSLGDSPELLAAALEAGRSGLAPVELFDPGELRVREAFGVRGFAPRDYLGDGNLRPLDRTAQLAAAAARLALGGGGGPAAEQPVGLVLGTMFGSVRTIAEFDRRALTAGPIYAKPMDFANSVINAAAGQTAIWHGLTGVNSTISAGTASGLQALVYAADLIAGGRAEALLAGGADELCFESFYGFYRAGLMAGSTNGGPCAVPFDDRRNGFLLGEGAALLMLESAAAARRRRAEVLAEILGVGMSYDASRGRDRGRSARAMARAVRGALDDAGLEPAAIDAASASANGSRGDESEARAIAEVFGELPTTAVKSMLGECLGASGAFQTVALLQAMASGVLPGIRGLERPGEGWPATMTESGNRRLDIRRGLVTALGLDGNACALVVERPKEGSRGGAPAPGAI